MSEAINLLNIGFNYEVIFITFGFQRCLLFKKILYEANKKYQTPVG